MVLTTFDLLSSYICRFSLSGVSRIPGLAMCDCPKDNSAAIMHLSRDLPICSGNVEVCKLGNESVELRIGSVTIPLL